MSEEIPAPGDRDKLFTPGEDWWHNACVGWSREQWIGYAEGYKRGADMLVQHVCESRHNQDFLIYPIVFLYRQAIEISLKYVLHKGRRLLDRATGIPRQHRLVPLWKECRGILEELSPETPKEQLDAVEDVLCQFDARDPQSTVFRYPVDTSGRPSLHTHEQINIRNLSEVANRVFNFLDGCGAGISEFLQQKYEMQRERSW